MSLENVSIFGAGTMGHGIAQVCATAGMTVTLYDIDQARVDAGLGRIRKNLAKAIELGKATEAQRDATLANLSGTTSLAAAAAEAVGSWPRRLSHPLMTPCELWGAQTPARRPHRLDLRFRCALG